MPWLFAHEQSIPPKDIKPGNILAKGEQIYFTDFGLAVDSTTADVSYTTTAFRSTFHYRTPESLLGHPQGRAADMISFGCVFTEIMTIF